MIRVNLEIPTGYLFLYSYVISFGHYRDPVPPNLKSLPSVWWTLEPCTRKKQNKSRNIMTSVPTRRHIALLCTQETSHTFGLYVFCGENYFSSFLFLNGLGVHRCPQLAYFFCDIVSLWDVFFTLFIPCIICFRIHIYKFSVMLTWQRKAWWTTMSDL